MTPRDAGSREVELLRAHADPQGTTAVLVEVVRLIADALQSWPRTLRLVVIIAVLGAVLALLR